MSGFESSLADEWDRYCDGDRDFDDLLDRADVERKQRVEDGLWAEDNRGPGGPP